MVRLSFSILILADFLAYSFNYRRRLHLHGLIKLRLDLDLVLYFARVSLRLFFSFITVPVKLCNQLSAVESALLHLPFAT